MKRKIVSILVLTLVAVTPLMEAAAAVKGSKESAVHLNGVRYYTHTVVKGDTLYSLAKRYNVGVNDILAANQDLQKGLNIGVTLKIPCDVEVEDSEVEASEEESEEIKAEKRAISEKRLRKTFDTHIVQQGETLYAISRQYEISVAKLLVDNPDLDPAHLAIGQSVHIRKTERGLSAEEQTVAELDQYRQQLNSIAPEGFAYYLVEDGDTMKSLSIAFDMSIADIERLNSLSKGAQLHVGTIVMVRELVDEDEVEEGSERVIEKGDVKPLSDDETLEIALLLPLSIRGYAMKPIVEFYQGFLLGVEELKLAGRSVVVNLFNTERSEAAVDRIIDDPAFERSDLIVGPVYEEFLPAVLADAERRRVPVVSPLATLESSDSPMLFQMAPNPANRYDKMDDLFGIEQRVTLIYGETNDSLYEAEVLSILARYNREVERYDYLYEHPSVISERERKAEEMMKLAEDEAELLGMMLDSLALDSLICHPSPSDLTPLISNEAVSNLFFILSDNETEVDRILSALASAYTSQVASNRGSGRKMSEILNFSVVANPAWRQYENIDRTLFFRDRVYNYPSYLAGRDSEVVRAFDGRYAAEFGDFATLYSYRGYDVAKIFGEGMFGAIEYNMMEQAYTPLQTEYRFEHVEGGQRLVNINWVRVKYNLDFTLKIE